MTQGQWIAIEGAKYQWRSFLYTTTTGKPEVALGFNPKRVYVRFELAQNAGSATWVFPGGSTVDTTKVFNTNLPVEFKLKDVPGMVQGEWLVFGPPAQPVVITEVQFMGV